MHTEDLSFKGSDPGATQYGNFINYYKFHSVEERMKGTNQIKFPEAITTSKTIICLDIGCNTGELTQGLHDSLRKTYTDKTIQILGIDIDPILIERAMENNKNNNITFINANIMIDETKAVFDQYLKQFEQSYFDITFCFSVIMWIHLNNGDHGLMDFIQRIKEYSRMIVVEIQPWKCYKTARRRLKKSNADFELFKSLKIRDNVEEEIERAIIKCNLYNVIARTEPSSWDRKIITFIKKG